MGVARGQAEEAGENRESLQPASTAGIQIRVDKEEYIGLRWAAAYWKARHGEAVQREADLKRDNEELRARIRELEGRLYSRRSECLVSEGKSPSRRPVSSRPRGQQPGSRGHGRSSLEGLEAREEVAELPQEQQKCPRCGRPLDPFPGTDEAQVVEAHFGADTVGILLSDRYVVYKKLARQWEGLELAFCWAHVRRDFFCLAKAWPEQEGWAMSWVEGIGGLFDLNRRRLQVRKQPESFAAWDRELRGALWGLARQRDAELGSPTLPKACKKVLRSLERHWEGLTVFLDHPEGAMDNNAAERALRGPVVGRKNYYGSGSRWSARLAAVLFTILQTLELWQINPQRWLSCYLQSCAESGNRAPPQLRRFLPWEMDPAQRAAWGRPSGREAA